MIRLDRTITPTFLGPTEVARLTQVFRATNDPVWNFDDLKAALLDLSYSKCAYCECQLSEESKYVEVEHFRHKKKYDSLVVEWTNLLPACKRCNAAKSDHDVEVEPIINPFDVDPRAHLAFRLYRFTAKTTLGDSTIEVLNLNDPDRLMQARFSIGESIQEALNFAIQCVDGYLASPTTRNRNRLVRHLNSVLKECIPPASYAATAATVLQGDARFKTVKARMHSQGIWSSELEVLDLESRRIALDSV